MLGEELREQGDKLKLGIRLKAEKAKAEFRVHAEKMMHGLNPKRRGPHRNEPLTPADAKASRGRARGRH